MNLRGLIFVLSVSLYPYVYVSSRAVFLTQSPAILEAATMLGAGRFTGFRKIALPLARPAVVAGLALVWMEVLNDYGAAHYYGVNTFTTAVFRTWFGLGEPATAVYLSAILCLFIFGSLLLERWQRRHKKYRFNAATDRPIRRDSLSKAKRGIAIGICLGPILVGFILPVLQMLYWSYLTAADVWRQGFWTLMGYSFLFAALTGSICVVLTIVLIYGSKWSGGSIFQLLVRGGTLGYAVPGVVIAIGIMIPTLMFDKWLVRFVQEHFDHTMKFLFNGTFIGLLYAYSVRFLAVAYNPIEAGVQKLGDHMGASAQTLGASRWRILRRINLPLLTTGIWSGALLVFVDVMKELPITLLMKPYGVGTLATKAYEYASDELIAESALPSLIIILTGLLPIILLNRLIKR